jgi:hypothetical protein
VDNNYLSTYSTTSSVVKSPSGINAPIVGTAVSQSGQTMVLVTAGTTNNVYHSNDYGATFTGLTLGSSPMVSCAVSYDGSSFSVMNTTGVVYTLNANSTGNTLAIGLDAGKVNQGTNAVAIGNKAGQVNQTAGSIVINATGSIVGTGVAGFYVSPIKNHLHSSDSMINLLGYGADNQIVQSNLSFNTSNLLTPDGIYAANPLYNNTLNLIGYSPSIPSVSGTNVLGGTFFLNSTNSWGYNVGASIALGGRGYNWGAGNLHMSFARISGVQQNNSIAYLGSFVVETANQGMMYERMRIDGNGNVGMGTDTPATKLHVVGTVTANTYTAPAGNWLAITNGAGSGRIDLQGGSILMQNAYVGIGTTVPGHALHVAGNVRATGHWFWEPSTNWYCDANANNQEFSFDLRNQGTYTGCYWHVWSDKNNRQILVVRGDTERVGIGPGVINPGYTLHVDGTIYASGEITGLSDQRYKKDIEPLTDSLTKVTQLRGVSYRHLDQETDKTHMGLLAQEVAEVYPDTVSYDEKNDRYSLNYISLIAPMIESIKALKAEVETLKSELRELRGV